MWIDCRQHGAWTAARAMAVGLASDRRGWEAGAIRAQAILGKHGARFSVVCGLLDSCVVRGGDARSCGAVLFAQDDSLWSRGNE